MKTIQDKRLSRNEPLRDDPVLLETDRRPPHKPARAQCLGSRWLEWAQALMARYAWMRARVGSPSMVIARPLKLSVRLHERWLLPAVRLYPQVNLSIQPILHLTVTGEAHGGKERHGLHAAPSQAMKRRAFRLFGEKTVFKPEAVVPQARTVMEYLKPEASFIERLYSLLREGNPQTTLVNQEKGRSFSTIGPERLKLTPQSSLQMVFQRLRYADASTEPSVTSLLQQSVTNLALRVVRQTERVERRGAAAPARVLTRPTALTEQRVTNPVFSTEHRAEAVPLAFNQPLSARAEKNFDQLSNMDEITEQVMRRIDSRVIAMRERMGQV